MKRALVLTLIALAACSTNESVTALAPAPSASVPTVAVMRTTGTLDLDLVSTADVTIDERADGTLDLKLTLGRGGGVLDPSIPLSGTGKVSRFPEADTTLYSAKLRAPALAGGRCGSMPVSLSFTLRRVGKNARVSGGLAAYCGDGVFEGAPAQVSRITGSL